MAKIVSINLLNFRNHKHFSALVDPNKPVVVTGPNGSGKTSILEAISLLYPGSGLRCSPVKDIGFQGDDWAADFGLVNTDNNDIDHYSVQTIKGRKSLKCNQKAVSSYKTIVQSMNFVWLNPKVDIILTENASELRKFFDRLVIADNPIHADHLMKYERVRKLRAKALSDSPEDSNLLCALENFMAEEAIPIVLARENFVSKLADKLKHCCTDLPSATVTLEGWLECKLGERNDTLDLQEAFKVKLSENRTVDMRSKRTIFGPHTSKFVLHLGDMNASICSTGEQKLALLKIIIAASSKRSILLLDDLNSHIDSHYRSKIAQILTALNVQSWVTTDNCDNDYNEKDFNIIELGKVLQEQ